MRTFLLAGLLAYCAAEAAFGQTRGGILLRPEQLDASADRVWRLGGVTLGPNGYLRPGLNLTSPYIVLEGAPGVDYIRTNSAAPTAFRVSPTHSINAAALTLGGAYYGPTGFSVANGEGSLIYDDANGHWALGAPDGLHAANLVSPLLTVTGTGGQGTITYNNGWVFSPALSVGGGGTWGSITGTLSDQTDLNNALGGKQPLDSDLTTIAALVPSASGKVLKWNGTAWSVGDDENTTYDLSGYLTSTSNLDATKLTGTVANERLTLASSLVGGILSASAQNIAGTKTFTAGLSGGFTLGAADTNVARTSGLNIPRYCDLDRNIFLDYQDELAYRGRSGYGTLTVTPAPDAGNASTPECIFEDNSAYIGWTARSGPWTVTVELDMESTPVVAKNSPHVFLGLTQRYSSAGSRPTAVKIEFWDSVAAAYVTMYDQVVTMSDDVWLSPRLQMLAASGSGLPKLRVTFTMPTTAAQFRIQRLMLYHVTADWDPWHLHIGGNLRGSRMFGSLEPYKDNSINLGHTTKKWANVYATNFIGSLSNALTAGTGLTSTGTYNGGTGRTFAVDFGTGATQAAAGNHLHTGVYQSASAALAQLAGLSPTTTGQIIKWNQTSGQWEIGTDNTGGGGLTEGGNLTGSVATADLYSFIPNAYHTTANTYAALLGGSTNASNNQTGVRGYSYGGYGVHGKTTSSAGIAVYGESSGSGAGVSGKSNSGRGIVAETTGGDAGMYAVSYSAYGPALKTYNSGNQPNVVFNQANGTHADIAQFQTSGSTVASVKRTGKGVFAGLNVGAVAEYADNAAALAGGLGSGDLYRTGDFLKVVH